VVVGDGACGKTSLLNVFVSGHFPEAYEVSDPIDLPLCVLCCAAPAIAGCPDGCDAATQVSSG
jgi:GTPase SAR1 family protein